MVVALVKRALRREQRDPAGRHLHNNVEWRKQKAELRKSVPRAKTGSHVGVSRFLRRPAKRIIDGPICRSIFIDGQETKQTKKRNMHRRMCMIPADPHSGLDSMALSLKKKPGKQPQASHLENGRRRSHVELPDTP